MNPVPRLHYACGVFLVGHPYVPLCSLRRVFHKVAAEKFDAAGTLIAYPDMHMRGFKRILSGIHYEAILALNCYRRQQKLQAR